MLHDLVEIGTRGRKAHFFDGVDSLVRIVEDCLRFFRLGEHGEVPVSELFPVDLVQDGAYSVEDVCDVMRSYLRDVGPEFKVGLVGMDDWRVRLSEGIERQVATFSNTVRVWREELYGKKDVIDAALKRWKEGLVLFAFDSSVALSDQLRRVGVVSCSVPFVLDGSLSFVFEEYRDSLYRRAGLCERPLELWKYAFRKVVEKKGWDKLGDEKIRSVLEEERVSVEVFEYCMDRILAPKQQVAVQAPVVSGESAGARAARAVAREQEDVVHRATHENIAGVLDDALAGRTPATKLPGPIPLSMIVDDFNEGYLVVENVRPYGRVDVGGWQLVHPYVLVAKDVLRDERGNVRSLGRYDAIRVCDENEMVLPPASVLCPVLVALHAARDRSYVAPTLAQFKDYGFGYGWHNVSTLISFGTASGEVIDYPEQNDFPEGWRGRARVNQGLRQSFSFRIGGFRSDFLEDVMRGGNECMIGYAQSLSGLEDPGLLVPVGERFQRPAYVTVPLQVGQVNGKCLAWVGCDNYCLNLSGGGSRDIGSAARGVQFSTSAPQARRA